MKHLLSILLFALSALPSVWAQGDTLTTDQLQEEFEIREEAKARDRLIMTLSFENLFHKETNGFDSRWHSRGVGFYFMYDIPIKNSEVVHFAPGLGVHFAAYYHNSFVIDDTTGTRFEPIDDFRDNDDYKRHRLGVSHLEIPLELRFFSKKTKFKAAIGFKAGVRIAAHTKEVRIDDEAGHVKRFKEKGFQDIMIARAGPTFRVGWGAFNLFGFYSVTELFKKDRGPSMTPFSIGISFNTL